METVTKEKIATHLKGQLGLSSVLCEEIAAQLFMDLINLTQNNSKLMLQNFGTWKINHKASRPGFNIRTGDAVDIKPRTVLRFTPANFLKDEINKSFTKKHHAEDNLELEEL